MARPTTKLDLTAAANSQFAKMWQLIDSMPDDERNSLFDLDGNPALKEAHWRRDKNLRNVLAHLYEWHQLLLNWVEANQAGNAQPFLPAPYNWKTYRDMNIGFWQKHQTTAYEDVRTMLQDSHRKVLAVIEAFTDQELFEGRHFAWTGNSTLGSYCSSSTSSHYDWAIKKIKAHRKSFTEVNR